MTTTLELIVDRERDRAEERPGEIALRSPEVGLFTRALPEGALLAPRAPAGVLHALGRSFELVVPDGVSGRVLNAPPERVLAPVGYGTVLYELAPLAAGAAPTAAKVAETAAGALVFPAPYSGRFWHRPAPNEPAFLREGDTLADGQQIGLIEVMKTFTHLVYHAGKGRSGAELPARARLVRFLVPDGGEVKDGGALLELERM